MSNLDDRLDNLSPEKRALLQRWLEQEQEPEAVIFEAPRTPTERTLAGIWSAALNVEHVGIHDDYFALGGDSILAILVVTRAQEEGLPLTTHDLFARPTIAQLAPLFDTAGEFIPDLPAVQPETTPYDAAIEAIYGLTPLQEGLLYHTLTAPGTGAYITQVTCRILGNLDSQRFAQAWQQAVNHHPVLRTAFLWTEGTQPQQVVYRRAELKITHQDWRTLSTAQQSAQLAAVCADDLRQDFDLQRPPLMRLQLIQLDDATLCIWSHHHLILDGWSQQLLLRELLDCYDALYEDRACLPPARPSFQSYVASLDQVDQKQGAAFWRDYLAGAQQHVVTGDSQAPTPERYAQTEVIVSSPSSEALSDWLRQRQLTLSTVLQGLWAIAAGSWNKADDIIFGMTFAGRPGSIQGVIEIIGCCINTLPVRLRLPVAGTLSSWLQDLQRQQATLRSYETTSLAQIQRWNNLPPGAMLFDTILVIENFPLHVAPEQAARHLSLTEIQANVYEHYPLVVEFTPSDHLLIRARYDRQRWQLEELRRLLSLFEYSLSMALSRPDILVDQLRQAVGGYAEQQQQAARSAQKAANAERLQAARRTNNRTSQLDQPGEAS